MSIRLAPTPPTLIDSEPMDISEFKKNAIPGHRSSVFDQHAVEIRALLKAKYSHRQVIDWLKTVNVTASKQALGKWIKRRDQDPEPEPFTAPPRNIESTDHPKTASQSPAPNTPESLDAVMGAGSQLDRYAAQRRKKS